MNKRFFVTFFMYFFVVQSAIFGVVWHEPKFYVIGLINLVFIVLMALFYTHFDAPADGEMKKAKSDHTYLDYSAHVQHASLHASKKGPASGPLGYVFLLSIFLLFLIVLDKSFFGIFTVSIWWFAAFYFVMLFFVCKKTSCKKNYARG